MPFYEVVATKPGETPIRASADDLKSAKQLCGLLFAQGKKLVFIRQYIKGGERYRILHTFTKRRFD